ncbi:MAG: ABC transporter permease subunit [Clostridia bacterium]|nr:ABC transporter permease subunit [Clostridia bacterium]
MKNILTILKKEFARFFKDRRMVLSIFLPGIMIFLVYTLMGTIMEKVNKVDENQKYTACVDENMPDVLSDQLSLILDIKEYESIDTAKADVAEGKLDLVILFPQNFMQAIENGASPDIQIYFNSAEDNSANGYGLVCGILETFKQAYAQPVFTINNDVLGDLAEERATVGKVLSMIMPMLMFSLLASGCIAVAPEAIAGEKERGTLSTVLITPIKRWQLAFGKIISLACFATLSGISSFIGLILSLPKLMNGVVSGDTAAYYSVGDYFMLLALIVSVVLVIISAFSIVSAYAKSVKEASSLIAPLMIVIILLGLFSMFTSTPELGLYAIPLLGSGFAFSSIMTFTISPIGFVLSIISNLVVAALLIVALSFMFKSERIMFNK